MDLSTFADGFEASVSVSFSTRIVSCRCVEAMVSNGASTLVSEDSLSDVGVLGDSDVVTESSLKRCERPGVDRTVDMFTLFMSDSCMQQ